MQYDTNTLYAMRYDINTLYAMRTIVHALDLRSTWEAIDIMSAGLLARLPQQLPLDIDLRQNIGIYSIAINGTKFLDEEHFDDFLPFATGCDTTDISLYIEDEITINDVQISGSITIYCRMPAQYKDTLRLIGKLKMYLPTPYETISCGY